MRLRGPTPVEIAAAVLVVVALAAVAAWIEFDAADAWMPNVATSAFFVAVTVTVIERAFRREYRPLAERALWAILSEYRSFCECVALDYEYAHSTTRALLPENQLQLLKAWLADQESEVNARRIGIDGVPALLRAAAAFAHVLRDTRTLYRGALAVDLAAEAANFEANVESARRVFTDVTEAPQFFRAAALAGVVEGALYLGKVLVRHAGGEAWLRRSPAAGEMIIYGPTWDAWQREGEE